ncbi:M20 family metallopeptidase [Psychromarinibacter halotolerans]|uniref:M20 family metallopeptidase n=2 Tax=Psychromarinibacter halotolerans TaxID=1775175 RepID=A0ABV7GVT4_9RHOB|nr:M20 family metallopeptidase [Psychromarinibacter halotolerans]MDF0598486.1 M20 family metallopeptidase [Psychromarinibacter halotolerans]
MSRQEATSRASAYVDDGRFARDMAARIAVRSESPREDSAADHLQYLQGQIQPMLSEMGFACRLLDNPDLPRLPALFAERAEDPGLPTVLVYGHGDVLWGMEGEWADGLSPWEATVVGDRLYGRGAVDNKGQHTINLEALRIVIETRGRLGFNAKILIEMGEECGSPGLGGIAEAHSDLLAADVLIASDGPRVSTRTPTVFLGARGSHGFTLRCDLREGGHHSGNWGGILPNAGIRLAQAISVITDAKGKIAVPEWRPDEIPANVLAALRGIALEFGPDDPQTDDDWGEPGLTGATQLLGWCNFEVTSFVCGNPQAPVNAIPGQARATCQLRYIAEIDHTRIVTALREHLDRHGFADVEIVEGSRHFFHATRTDPDNAWVRLAVASITQTMGAPPALSPNFGGALPNEVFAETLGLPTIWIPHSHPACAQHAPNEHMMLDVAREGTQMMAGLFWDIGDGRLGAG